MRALILLLLLCIVRVAFAEPLTATVTCSLPNERVIWPLPSATAPILVAAEFGSFDELLRVRSGDYFEVTSRVVYRVSSRSSDFPHGEISFILRERWATPESRIMEKRLPRFFIPGTKARFWMSRRAYEKLWDIQTYEIWDAGSHYKPKT